MTNSTLHVVLFFLISSEVNARGLSCNSPMQCICIKPRPDYEIECHHEACDESSLKVLLHLQLPANVTLINCAEKTYFHSLMNRLDSVSVIKLHHLSRGNPIVNSIEGNMGILEVKHYTVFANTFDGLSQLVTLTIKFSRISVDDPFRNLRNLRELDLSFNGISSKLTASEGWMVKYKIRMLFNILSEYIFEPLIYLRRLNFSHNSLWIVQKDDFQHLVNVEEIDLSYNFIHAIETYAFVTNVKLKVLSLRNNKIKVNEVYGSVMIYPRGLEILDLRNNNLSYILDEWMKPAFTIDLRNNSINTVNLQLLQSALEQNITVDFSETSEIKSYYKHAIFLSGNPASQAVALQNLVTYFKVVKDNATLRDQLDLASLKCVKTNRYLCPLNQNRTRYCPKECVCLVAPWEFSYIMNCTGRTKNKIPKLIIPSFLKGEMYLEGNFLKSGPGVNMGFESVTKLYLSGNDIEVISWIPEKLEVLEIHNNNLGLLDIHIVEMLNKSKAHVTLHDNPWRCDCESSSFIRAMQSLIHHKQIDAKDIRCGKGDELLVNLSDSEICPTILKFVLTLLACLTTLGLVSSALVILYYKFGYDLKIYLFAKKLCLACVKRRELYPGRKYDAFVCYNFKDEEFVYQQLLPVLEGGPNPYKICIHVRDWFAGEFIIQQMIWSIEQSKRTIVVMSPDYLNSNWAMMELRLAYDRVVEGNAEIIIVLYKDINMEGLVDEDLKQYLRTCRVIQWGKPRFWDKLKYVLPHL